MQSDFQCCPQREVLTEEVSRSKKLIEISNTQTLLNYIAENRQRELKDDNLQLRRSLRLAVLLNQRLVGYCLFRSHSLPHTLALRGRGVNG